MPIGGSLVTLYAAGSAYGNGATRLARATTDAGGNFALPSYTCPAANPQIYFTALGGNAGHGANSAIGLMAAPGPCNSLSKSAKVSINELTTVAAQSALAQFLDATGSVIGAPARFATGLKNAYGNFANLAAVNASNLSVSGNPSGFLPSAAACAGGTPPVNCDGLKRLDTLADILAACVESAPLSTICAKLKCDATPGLTYNSGTNTCSGTPLPTSTLGAAHLIATNPANNASALFGLASANTPFSPSLGAAPDGWEIGLNFAASGAKFNGAIEIALDAGGNVFVANIEGNSVSELTASSSYTKGLNFAPSGAKLNFPLSMALDGAGNVFVANEKGDSVSELTASSSYATGLNFAPSGAGLNPSFRSIALDASGDVWVGNITSVSELTAGSGYATGHNFAPAGAKLEDAVSITLDASGNVFVANENSKVGNSVSELTATSSYTVGLNFAPNGASFAEPLSIALDASGNVFAGNVVGTVSELTASSDYATGLNFLPAGAKLELDYPGSIAVDGSGNVFAANETDGNSVSELTASSSYTKGLNFAPSGASFSSPDAIALDRIRQCLGSELPWRERRQRERAAGLGQAGHHAAAKEPSPRRSNSNSNSNSDLYADIHYNSHTDPDPNAHTNAPANCYPHGNTDSDTYSSADSHDTHTPTPTAAHTIRQ